MVAAALATALVVPVGASPASAAVAPGTTGSLTFKFSGSGCAVDTSRNRTEVTPPLPVGGGSYSVSRSDYATASDAQGPVAILNAQMSPSASVATRSGGLASFTIAHAARAWVTRTVEPIDCGAGGPLAGSYPTQTAELIEPVVAPGWLDVTAAASGSGNWQVSTYLFLLPPTGAGTAVIPMQDVTGSWTRRIYVPAGWSVDVRLDSFARAALYNPTDAQRSSASVSASIRGTFTPAGAAVNAAHGKRFARRSVVLPSAVSCSGSAAVRLTRYAKKKAKSVTFLVNGHRVRKVKRIKRARTLGIRVPTSGPITISAKVTPKHGKTARVTRSYAACH